MNQYHCNDCGAICAAGEFEQHQITVPVLCDGCYVSSWNFNRWPVETYGREPYAPPDGYGKCICCGDFYRLEFTYSDNCQYCFK